MVGVRTYGRMGNFLFQAAACIGYALKHGLEFSLPSKTKDPFWNPLYLQHLASSNYNQSREDILINENGHEYKEIPFKEEWRDLQIVINGYYQSEKYFKEYRNEIIYLFNFPYELKKDLVSIHVRRGDYLKLIEKHPPVTKEWYEKAMAMFPDKQFKFFSDEIKWCKDTFGHRSDCSFSTNSTEVDDLVEMSCCEHNINSSSTFSWWSAWLNQNPDKIIVTPKKWFQDGWMGMNTNDIIPETWIKL
jgi:hypothetical protein